ncbi:MAG: hypothetical protein ACLFPE_15160 [Bacteroidales bacterium]
MAQKRKKKRKATKYRIISFKLTDRQKKSLEKNCRVRRTTPIKLIKRSIDHFLSLQAEEKPPNYATPNQLDLFGEEEAETNTEMKKE